MALSLVGAFQAPSVGTAASAGTAADFSKVVTEILSSQTEGAISEMGDEQKEDMIACVNKTLQDVPKGMKRRVVEGETYDERERRFGKLMYNNHAEWMQNIAGACASVALRHYD